MCKWYAGVREPRKVLMYEPVQGRPCVTACVGAGHGYKLTFIKCSLLARQDAKCFTLLFSFNLCGSK